MACPTCDHTMQGIGKDSDNVPLFWCPRCGTIKANVSNSFNSVPKLVPRARVLVDVADLLSDGIGETDRRIIRSVLDCCAQPENRHA